MPILEFINAVAVVSNGFLIAFTSTFGKDLDTDRGPQSPLWALVIFEHICFFLKFLLRYFIKDVPESVRKAERRRKYRVERKFKEAGVLRRRDSVQSLAATMSSVESRRQSLYG